MSTESAGFDIDRVVSDAVVSDAIVGESGRSDEGPDDSGDPGVEQQQPVLTEWTASSRTGSITVRTTEQGLPLGISVDPAELKRDPRALASEVVRLCKQAANRAALARRTEFEEAGVAPEMLRLMRLPTTEEVAQAELREEDEYETEPESWLRSI
ncbi:hypothetical protein [Nocardia albiluteola]|uniref:hypothetical protein n=1 Tax=Nocardia albiluteola TaxID=2842303 RepID=UPI0027E0E66B|nr:hypothetical protein [Nocardia albiluteola]